MGRYSDIRRGAELNAALAKLRAYEDLTREQKQAAYKAQRGSSVKVNARRVKGYVESFGLVGRIFLPVQLLDNTQQTEGVLIGMVRTAVTAKTHAITFVVPATGVTLDGLSGYRPARFSATKRGEVVADNKSRVTDIEYKRYDNKSVGSPFGAGADAETYISAVNDIKGDAAITSFLGTAGNRISFTPEVL